MDLLFTQGGTYFQKSRVGLKGLEQSLVLRIYRAPALGQPLGVHLAPGKHILLGKTGSHNTNVATDVIRAGSRTPRKPYGARSFSHGNIPALICQGQGKPWQHHLPRCTHYRGNSQHFSGKRWG